MNMRRQVMAIVAPAAVSTVAWAGDPAGAASDGRLLWSAFQCSTFASMGGDETEAERLFKAGYEAGLAFVSAVRAGAISEDNLKSGIPVAVLLTLQGAGPTDEFMVGRLFESATVDAFDRVVKLDDAGGRLDVADWVMDPTEREIRASSLYDRSNCSLIDR